MDGVEATKRYRARPSTPICQDKDRKHLILAQAPSSWPLSFRLSSPRSSGKAIVDQTSRIQHNISFFWLSITESCRTPQVRASASISIFTVDLLKLYIYRYLQSATNYYGSSTYLQPGNFPSNETTAGLASGLAEAHRAYGVEGYVLCFISASTSFPKQKKIADSFRCTTTRTKCI